MPLQDQVIPIDFGQGIDSKTDPKLVVAGKMLRLENCVFTNIKRITKRNGYNVLSNVIAGSGTTAGPKMVHEYNDELIAADKNLLISYSPSELAWMNRGNYTSTQLSRTTVDQESSDSGFNDVAILGNYALYGWSTVAQTDLFKPPHPSNSRASVVDLTTGTVLAEMTPSESILPERYNAVKCVLLGGVTLAVIYIKDDYTELMISTVVFSGSGVVSFSAPVSVTTNYAGAAAMVTAPQFDVVETALGATLGYFTSVPAGAMTGVTLANINTAGAVTGTVSIADAAAYGPIHVSRNSTSNDIWVYFSRVTLFGFSATALSTVYAVFTSALAPVLATTVIEVGAAPFYVSNLIAVSNGAANQTIYYGKYTQSAAAGNLFVDYTSTVTISSAGVIGAITTWAYGITPFSRPATITVAGPLQYAVFIYRGAKQLTTTFPHLQQEQPTYFLMKLADASLSTPLVVARFGSGVGNSQAILTEQIGFTGNVPLLSTSKFLFTCGLEIQEIIGGPFVSGIDYPGGVVGVFSYEIDFAGQDTYRATNAGDLAVLNGGLMQIYDGQSCTEFGFHLYPEITRGTNGVTAGGLMVPGTYGYIAIFQWTDAQGNLHQSAPSTVANVTLGGGDNFASVTVAGYYVTQKTGIVISLYRTTNLGNVYYLVTDPIFATPVDGALYVTFADLASDAQISGALQAYTYPGSPVLENNTPPPSMIMQAHNNRLWFVDAEQPWTIFYTKSVQVAVGLSPSGFMFEQLDQKFGDVSALSEMDDKLVVFKPKGLCVFTGDGVDDTGSKSTLSFPHFIPSDVGCSVLKSVVTTPVGVIFKSDNGIYILDRALSVSYIGMQVEQYNSQLITSAVYVVGKSQIRILMSTGLTIVYDYIFNQWSTFTNHTGVSSTSWQNIYVYATTAGTVFKEAPGYYKDDTAAFALLAQTAWLALATVQGFQRVRKFNMLGDYVNGASALHAIQVEAAYDFETTFSAPIPFVFGLAATGSALQYMESLPRQKCDAITLRITETTTGDSLEYLDLSNMSFEAGVKRGLNKLPPSKSVG